MPSAPKRLRRKRHTITEDERANSMSPDGRFYDFQHRKVLDSNSLRPQEAYGNGFQNKTDRINLS